MVSDWHPVPSSSPHVVCLSPCVTDRAKSFVGTPEYVSPELLQEKVAFKR